MLVCVQGVFLSVLHDYFSHNDRNGWALIAVSSRPERDFEA